MILAPETSINPSIVSQVREKLRRDEKRQRRIDLGRKILAMRGINKAEKLSMLRALGYPIEEV